MNVVGADNLAAVSEYTGDLSGDLCTSSNLASDRVERLMYHFVLHDDRQLSTTVLFSRTDKMLFFDFLG